MLDGWWDSICMKLQIFEERKEERKKDESISQS
jgi:hypothetical protein